MVSVGGGGVVCGVGGGVVDVGNVGVVCGVGGGVCGGSVGSGGVGEPDTLTSCCRPSPCHC